MERLKEVIKLIDIMQIIDFILFPFIWLISLIYKPFLSDIWLIEENPNEACDNGYIFFKYLRENNKDINVYYVINKKSKDYDKVSSLGNIIHHKSLKHWIYYLDAKKIIVTQKYANPSPALFYILHKYNLIKTPRIFIQHGITKDECRVFYYDRCKFRLYTCGAKSELEYIKNHYGYPEENLVYTGLARFDNLQLNRNKENVILITPTWRKWLKSQKDFDEFMSYYYEILNDKEINNLLKEKNIKIKLILHKNLKQYKINNNFNNKNIIIKHNCEVDIQRLINEATFFITDFSSIFFDLAYRMVPMIYYQFDENEYRSKQLDNGFFDYKKEGFGEVVNKKEDIIKLLKKYIENDFKVEDKYLKRMNLFFERKDKENSKRILDEIERI